MIVNQENVSQSCIKVVAKLENCRKVDKVEIRKFSCKTYGKLKNELCDKLCDKKV